MTKIQGKEIVAVDTDQGNNVIDLMEALQKSLELTKYDKVTGTA
jgi:DNA end-binding protein Ku